MICFRCDSFIKILYHILNNSFFCYNFKKFIKDKNLKIIHSQTVPDPKTSNIEIVSNFRNAIKEKTTALNTFTLAGYIASELFIDLLKKIEGKITKEKIIEEAKKLKFK